MKIRMAKSTSSQILLSFCHWLHKSILSFALQANREGIIKTTGKSLPDHPGYSQICIRRVKKLDIATKRSDNGYDKDIIIAIDSTGIKVTNRGQWMQEEKWQQIRNKKCYLNIHVAVNIKTKEIIALEVTDEKSHDGKVIPKLIEHFLENNNDIKIKQY